MVVGSQRPLTLPTGQIPLMLQKNIMLIHAVIECI